MVSSCCRSTSADRRFSLSAQAEAPVRWRVAGVYLEHRQAETAPAETGFMSVIPRVGVTSLKQATDIRIRPRCEPSGRNGKGILQVAQQFPQVGKGSLGSARAAQGGFRKGCKTGMAVRSGASKRPKIGDGCDATECAQCAALRAGLQATRSRAACGCRRG